MRLYLRHETCRHEWPSAHIPMDAKALGLLMTGARCPACGSDEGIMAFEAREPTVAEALRPS